MGHLLGAGAPSSGSGPRMRDPELTDFESDLLESIAQAKLDLHARVHFPPTTHERANVDEINDRNGATLPKSAT